MTTELATIDAERYPALAKNSDVAEAMAANLTGGETLDVQDLTRVPIPTGGGTTWTWDGLAGEETAKELVGLLVHVAPRGILWPSEEPTNAMPLLVSHDLKTAERVNDDPGDIPEDLLDGCRLPNGRYDWLALPWNQWGSGKGGVGKRCKEMRLLFLLREGDAWPMIVAATPGSLKTVRPFVKKLPVPHWRAVVSLTLQKVKSQAGQEYAQIVPRYVGCIDKKLGERVKAIYTDSLRAVAHDVIVEPPSED